MVVRYTGACLALARGSLPRRVLSHVVAQVLAPRGLPQKCKYETATYNTIHGVQSVI
jgi:hypothetical protein